MVNGEQRKRTRNFATRREAMEWARAEETHMGAGFDPSALDHLTFSQLVRRYLDEVTPTKKTAKQEVLRLNRFMSDYPQLARKPMSAFGRRDVALWKEARGKHVSSATVAREWNSLSAVVSCAIKDWGLPINENPFHMVRKPKAAVPREQRITPDEVQAFLDAFRYDGQRRPTQAREHVAWCFLFAIETAMRAGEILKLQADDIGERTATLRNTKNGTDRTVPLSREARRLLTLVDLPLPVSSASLDALFRRYRPDALCHIHFHDTRHEALSRMAKKIHNPMDLAKISGHKDVNILMNVYYNPDDSHLADLLD